MLGALVLKDVFYRYGVVALPPLNLDWGGFISLVLLSKLPIVDSVVG